MQDDYRREWSCRTIISITRLGRVQWLIFSVHNVTTSIPRFPFSISINKWCQSYVNKRVTDADGRIVLYFKNVTLLCGLLHGPIPRSIDCLFAQWVWSGLIWYRCPVLATQLGSYNFKIGNDTVLGSSLPKIIIIKYNSYNIGFLIKILLHQYFFQFSQPCTSCSSWNCLPTLDHVWNPRKGKTLLLYCASQFSITFPGNYNIRLCILLWVHVSTDLHAQFNTVFSSVIVLLSSVSSNVIPHSSYSCISTCQNKTLIKEHYLAYSISMSRLD